MDCQKNFQSCRLGPEFVTRKFVLEVLDIPSVLLSIHHQGPEGGRVSMSAGESVRGLMSQSQSMLEARSGPAFCTSTGSPGLEEEGDVPNSGFLKNMLL